MTKKKRVPRKQKKIHVPIDVPELRGVVGIVNLAMAFVGVFKEMTMQSTIASESTPVTEDVDAEVTTKPSNQKLIE